MDLDIKKGTALKAIQKHITDEIARQKQRFITQLFVVGEKCVNDARLNGSYTDRTRNLRGSTGYVIVDNGTILTVGGFQQLGEGVDGPKEGRNYATELAGQIGSNSIALIVVAGMNYAYYVEKRGYNVLQSAEILAERLINELYQKMG